MIKKLEKQNTWGECLEKLNELVDAVNKHEDIIRQIGEWGTSKGECLWCANLTEVNLNDRMIGCTTLDIPESYKNDPYAEQRWVGHLCKLWTGYGLVRYGILRGVALNRKKTKYPYQALSTSFEHCEPVKPDDDIIYKGE